ncbi:hypothetical protein DVH24_001523 [Malus domestica]|uniref:Uncharacterized protein n=1 Tax=Malus domestica TaxID=3750 RepID=A0A498JZF2_MALDO|nr:hypothetical protein DVH24_001523 [Malus domestica]
MSAYATLTRESDLENEVTSTFDFNAENLVARGHAAFFKIQITDIEKEKELCRARIEQLKKIEHGHILWVWWNCIKVSMAKTDWLDIQDIDKHSVLPTKEIEKFMTSSTYIDAMGEQYNQGYHLGLHEGFEIFRRYVMKVDVNGKWVTIDYYKAFAVGATR